jgi:hypothetical protein
MAKENTNFSFQGPPIFTQIWTLGLYINKPSGNPAATFTFNYSAGGLGSKMVI